MTVSNDDLTFTVTCKMKSRWVPYFLGMLRQMEFLGNLGGSRDIVFHSDGDGDYRPKFAWDRERLPLPALPDEQRGDTFFDAG